VAEGLNTSNSGFIGKVGSWTNRNSHVIARIPGAFSIFRKIYNKLYPISKEALIAAAHLPRSKGRSIEKIMIVSPQSWHSSNVEWKPATGSYFYEIWQSANERYGEKSVFLHQIEPEDNEWQQSLLDQIQRDNPTHILVQGEENPNGDPNGWTSFAYQLGKVWDGQFILLMYDSVYWWHIFQAENIARIFPQTSVHAIDRFPNELCHVLNISGPGVLPTSMQTLKELEKTPAWKKTSEETNTLTFVGSLYPDRQKQLKEFEEYGIPLEINPHRKGRTDRPSYAEYSAAIGHSWATINLSRNHGMPFKHVKTRVLEAPLFGTVLFSDEKDLSKLMIPEDSFVYFGNKKDLARKVKYFQEHPEEFEQIKLRGHTRAIEIANSIFWEVIEEAVVY
jgi:hypothetical protein